MGLDRRACLPVTLTLTLALAACENPPRVQQLVAGVDVAFVAVDDDAVYWGECPPAGCGAGDGTIQRLAKQAPAGDAPQAVGLGRELIAAGGALFWTDARGTVSRRDADGMVATLFERSDAADRALGRDAGHLYQALAVAAPARGWEIWSIPLDGTAPALLASEAGDSTVFDVTSDGTYLYWTLAPADPAAASGEIRRLALGGGGAPEVFAPDLAARPQRIQQDAANVYWTAAALGSPALASGHIYRTPKAGGDTVSLAALWGDGDLTIDDAALYWAGPAEGNRVAIARFPLDGGDPSTLASSTGGSSTDVTVDATTVYWTVSGSPVAGSGLMRAFKR